VKYSDDKTRMWVDEAVFGIPLYERVEVEETKWTYKRVGLADSEAAADAWLATGEWSGHARRIEVRPCER
jgi:hypothetical protein